MDQQEAKPNLLKIKLTQTGTGPGTPVDEVCVCGWVCFVCVWMSLCDVCGRVCVWVGLWCGCGWVWDVPTLASSSVDQPEAKPNLLKIKLTQTGTGPGTPVDEVWVRVFCVCGCLCVGVCLCNWSVGVGVGV